MTVCETRDETRLKRRKGGSNEVICQQGLRCGWTEVCKSREEGVVKLTASRCAVVHVVWLLLADEQHRQIEHAHGHTDTHRHNEDNLMIMVSRVVCRAKEESANHRLLHEAQEKQLAGWYLVCECAFVVCVCCVRRGVRV